jgi:hypothetical protein
MLNTSLALDAEGPVPTLAALAFAQPPPSWATVKAALMSRPELAAGRAEIVRAEVHAAMAVSLPHDTGTTSESTA